MDKPDTAVSLHKQGSNCAQSVLCTFSGQLGFDVELAHRLATGFGAGLGRRQHLCGAVSGGAMALGAALGNTDGSDLEAKERTYALVQEYIKTLEAEFGTIECGTLLGVDLKTAEGKADFKARGLDEAVCNRIIRRATELVQQALA